MGAYFENLAIANIDGLLTELHTQLSTLTGIVSHAVNTSTTTPASTRAGRETLYQMPGIAGDGNLPCGVWLNFARIAASGINEVVRMTGHTGIKGPIAINRFRQDNSAGGVAPFTGALGAAGLNVQIETVGDPGFRVGDLVHWNGVTNANADITQGSTLSLVQSIVNNGTVWVTRIVMGAGVTSQAVDSSGGYVWAVYNQTGLRHGLTSSTAGSVDIRVLDAAMQLRGYVDEYRICGVIQQTTNTFPFFIGLAAREHIQDDESSVALTSAQVVVAAPGNVTFTLDRNCTKFYVGGKVHLISPSSALPDGVGPADVSQSTLREATIQAIPATNQLTLTMPAAETWPAGTRIGRDPLPLVVIGSGATAPGDLTGAQICVAHSVQGTRSATGSYGYVASNVVLDVRESLETATDPDDSSHYLGADIVLRMSSPKWERTLSIASQGPGPTGGWFACPVGAGSPINLDLLQIGDPSAVSATRFFKYFNPPVVAVNYALAMGHGAV